jgi:pimeloyl-ACP methyl ester carboxylesterase
MCLSSVRLKSSLTRRLARIVMVALVVAAGPGAVSSVMAQEAPAGEPKMLTAKDGWPVHITYYEAVDAGKETPVIVMLHGQKESRLVWKQTQLITLLVQDKFAVVTVDLRKHGESKAPETAPAAARNEKVSKFDYIAMAEKDLEAVKKFLYQEHEGKRLNIRKTGLVAADFSAVIAANWAAADWIKKPYDDAPTLNARTPRGQDVQAMLLFSPDESVKGLNVVRALPLLRGTGMAAMLLYGGKNSKNKSVAVKIFNALGGKLQVDETRRLYERAFATAARGTALLKLNLGKPSPAEFGLLFFRKHLKDLKGVNYDWRDRTSRVK